MKRILQTVSPTYSHYEVMDEMWEEEQAAWQRLGWHVERTTPVDADFLAKLADYGRDPQILAITFMICA